MSGREPMGWLGARERNEKAHRKIGTQKDLVADAVSVG